MLPDDFDEAMRAAAHRADKATQEAMREYRIGNVVDEEEITGELVGELNARLRGQIKTFRWGAKIFRHRRGVAAEEKAIGADLLIQVSVKARGRSYQKGVLIQSKRLDRGDEMSKTHHDELRKQCGKMLRQSPSSYVFDYDRRRMRVGSATRIRGTSNRAIYDECTMTPFRFFYDLFMCPIGDPRIKSTQVADLPLTDDVRRVLKLTATRMPE
jgi:hypothetical protein